MRRFNLVTLGLTLAVSGSAAAGTFDSTRLAPDYGVDALTRSVARQQVGRDVFANPYATVTLETMDVYNVFPYVESRSFQIVSDPRWNRLVFGELGRDLGAYSGAGQPLGALKAPRGMAVDERNRLYVADTGNDRIVVFAIHTEFDAMTLTPLFEIPGLSGPYDVAYSDGGTPNVADDDYLYVADTGRNRVVEYQLVGDGARQIAALGDLGSGASRFAGPMAIAVGRADGANTSDVYVADAHNRRIVHLKGGAGLAWLGDAADGASVVTSLDTDRWGNVYAAAPQQGVVRKFSAALTPVADLSGVSRPRSFEIPTMTVRDHRTGTVERNARASGLATDEWTDASGMTLWNLGVDVSGLKVVDAAGPTAQFTLTDRASVTLDVVDAASGRSLARQSAGALDAGAHDVTLSPDAIQAAGGADVVLRLSAASAYAGGPTAYAATSFRMQGGNPVAMPSRPLLLGNTPNPARSTTWISFLLPAGSEQGADLRLFDASGRLVRQFRPQFASGLNQVLWDGRDERGISVPAGVYFYRLRALNREFTNHLVMVR